MIMINPQQKVRGQKPETRNFRSSRKKKEIHSKGRGKVGFCLLVLTTHIDASTAKIQENKMKFPTVNANTVQHSTQVETYPFAVANSPLDLDSALRFLF